MGKDTETLNKIIKRYRQVVAQIKELDRQRSQEIASLIEGENASKILALEEEIKRLDAANNLIPINNQH